jgi:putative membrane protein
MVFISWKQPLAKGVAPTLSAQQVRRVHLCLRAELAGIIGILLAAALMARGFGYLH